MKNKNEYNIPKITEINEDNIKNKIKLAASIDTAQDTLEFLSSDSDPRVRYLVAGNLSTPLYVLENMMQNNAEEKVREMARKNLEEMEIPENFGRKNAQPEKTNTATSEAAD